MLGNTSPENMKEKYWHFFFFFLTFQFLFFISLFDTIQYQQLLIVNMFWISFDFIVRWWSEFKKKKKKFLKPLNHVRRWVSGVVLLLLLWLWLSVCYLPSLLHKMVFVLVSFFIHFERKEKEKNQIQLCTIRKPCHNSSRNNERYCWGWCSSVFRCSFCSTSN